MAAWPEVAAEACNNAVFTALPPPRFMVKGDRTDP
jgi:hypothetical protein